MGVSIWAKYDVENVTEIDTPITVCIKCAANAVFTRVMKNKDCKKEIRAF